MEPAQTDLNQQYNREIISALLLRYWNPLTRRCKRLGLNANAAEEVNCTLLARLLKRNPTPDLSRDRLPELFSQSNPLCIEKLSGQKRRDSQWLASFQPSFEKDRLTQAFCRVIEYFDKTTQNLAIYHYIDRMPIKEICSLSQLSETKVEKRLHRFRQKAHEILEINHIPQPNWKIDPKW